MSAFGLIGEVVCEVGPELEFKLVVETPLTGSATVVAFLANFSAIGRGTVGSFHFFSSTSCESRPSKSAPEPEPAPAPTTAPGAGAASGTLINLNKPKYFFDFDDLFVPFFEEGGECECECDSVVVVAMEGRLESESVGGGGIVRKSNVALLDALLLALWEVVVDVEWDMFEWAYMAKA